MDHDAKRAQFRRLHESGTFTMPNPHDVGSCRLLTELGFPALATTSGGFAYSLGRLDMTVGRDALVAHVAALVAATHVPLNLELKLEVWDSPNSAGVIIDAVRCAKAALDRKIGGPLIGPSAYFMKSPPVQYHDDVAHEMVEAFARGDEAS